MEKKDDVVASGDKLGYAFTYIQDFGGGRQVQVAFGLTPNAPKEALDAEMDKLRTVMDRQRAHITIRDTDAKLGAERKMLAALEHMIATYGVEMDKQIKGLEISPRANQNVVKGQIDSMRAQSEAYRQNKQMEANTHKTNIAIAEAVIEGAKKEIEG